MPPTEDQQDPNAADVNDDDQRTDVPEGDDNEPAPAPTQAETDEAALAEGGFPQDFTAEDLEGLSDEEIASIVADQQAAKPKEEEPAPVEEKPAEEEPQAKEPEPAPKPEFDVETAQTTLADLTKQRAKLLEDFKDGEIGDDEFQQQWDQFDESIGNAKAEIIAAQRTTQSAQHQIEQKWYADVDAYLSDHPDLQDEAHLPGFDAELKFVTGTYPNISNEAAIRLAHTRYAPVAEAMGKPLSTLPDGTKPAPKADPKPQEPAPQTEQRRQRELPPTLNNVPSSDMGGYEDGRYAQVERAIDADPFEGEQAFERMSPEDQERFLAS